MLDTIGIPASLIPVNDAARHPKSDPNKNGSGAFKESRSRPNARQIRMVLACTMRLGTCSFKEIKGGNAYSY